MTPAERQAATEPGRYVSITKAAAAWEVSRRTIYNWVYRKKVATITTPSGAKRVWVPDQILNLGEPAVAQAS